MYHELPCPSPSVTDSSPESCRISSFTASRSCWVGAEAEWLEAAAAPARLDAPAWLEASTRPTAALWLEAATPWLEAAAEPEVAPCGAEASSSPESAVMSPNCFRKAFSLDMCAYVRTHVRTYVRACVRACTHQILPRQSNTLTTKIPLLPLLPLPPHVHEKHASAVLAAAAAATAVATARPPSSRVCATTSASSNPVGPRPTFRGGRAAQRHSRLSSVFLAPWQARINSHEAAGQREEGRTTNTTLSPTA